MRGLKTLNLRMDRHCLNAQALAELLRKQPEVEVLHYPGLASFPQHALAKKQMAQPGGMLAFELKGGSRQKAPMNALCSCSAAPSAFGAMPESPYQHPASMTHSSYTPEERARYGISEGLVRLSVGLEDIEDLLADIRQALKAAV